jgi:peptide deformylase
MMELKIVDSKEVEGVVCDSVCAEDVETILKEMVPQMVKILFDMKGIGLAAPQVGVKKRFFIISNGQNAVNVFFNAKYAKDSDGKVVNDEGCLSYANGKQHLPVKRFKKVLVMWEDWDGKAFVKRSHKFNGMLGTVFQHEIDHTNGTTIFTRR